jgi:class 3 adenylate cyclase
VDFTIEVPEDSSVYRSDRKRSNGYSMRQRERAARGGLAILDAISDLNQQPAHAKLSARIGIDSGLVVIGKGAGQYETAPFRSHEVPWTGNRAITWPRRPLA